MKREHTSKEEAHKSIVLISDKIDDLVILDLNHIIGLSHRFRIAHKCGAKGLQEWSICQRGGEKFSPMVKNKVSLNHSRHDESHPRHSKYRDPNLRK
ncbi:hypothetical protein HPP92_003846 [Vanilla planifolia]|uniref:Uncharacterized protein n=1 Tax=Vanilla planifolia TaxID=51239 RepID=A0A835S8U1_VANPL|nr:hypothetical protein HPP92_003846 [Vanilla planifolia]